MSRRQAGFAMRRALLVLAGAAAAAAGGFVAWRRLEPGPVDDAAAARLLGLRLPDAQGRAVDFARFRGRTLVVNFWASWCPPCVEEMPELSRMQADVASLGVQIVGIGVDSAANIRRFADKTPIQYPLVVAGSDALQWMRELGNTQNGLPFTVVLDPSGRVRTRILGRFSGPALRAAIEAAARGA